MVAGGIMKIEELMEKLGLTIYEQKVYMALLKLSEANSHDIIKESTVPRGRIYDVFESLTRKGLITSLPTKPKRYKINDPKKSIKSFLGEKQDYLVQLAENVDNIKIPQIQKENTEEFELIGSEKIYKQKYREFKNRVKKDYVALVSGLNPPRYVGYETRHMLKRGVQSKTIIRELNEANAKYVKEKVNLGSKIKSYPIKGIRFVIIDNKEILVSMVNDEDFNRNGITVYTTNADLINSMQEFFDSIWKKAKIINGRRGI